MQTKTRLCIAMVALCGFVGTPALADEMFLRLDGIAGDSADPQHTGEIVVTSYGLGVEAETSWTKGAGASIGKPNPGELRFTALIDRSIAGMVLKITEGKAVPTATLTVRADTKGNRTTDYLRYSFAGLFFTSIGQGLTGAGRSAVAIAGVYKSIKIEVLASDGRVASCAFWDVSTGATEDCASNK